MLKIKQLRLERNMTQSDLSELTGISKRMIAAYEANENDITFSKMQKIASAMEININDLYVDNNYSNKKAKDIYINEDVLDYQTNRLIEINPNSSVNTLMADFKASAGIGNILTDEKALCNLPGLTLPNAPVGLNIAFQINGDSMHPTIRHLDYVAGNRINNIDDIRSGYVYVLVDKDDGVVCKRIYKEGDYLQIVSDNTSYPPYKRTFDNIVAFFKCFCRVSFDFRSYNDDLKSDVLDLKLRLNEVETLLKK